MPLLRRPADPPRFRGQGLNRRRLVRLSLAALIVGGGVALAPRLRGLFAPPLSFEPIPGLDGFRRIAGGDVSTGRNAALLGLDGTSGASSGGQPDCAALFSAPRPAGTVPIAYFSDARCAWCRVMSPLLRDLGRHDAVAITWHELPLLGQTSEVSARAALAADRQGAFAAFHHRLMGTPFLPTEAYLRRLAEDEGIDPDRLLSDMHSKAVDDRLAATARLARLFGFYGTPGLVVGRTVVLGNTPEALLRRLIAAERAEPLPGPCA